MADPDFVAWVEPSCPAGTAVAAYTLTPAGVATVMLHTMEVRIPPGHQGFTGLALIDSGTFVIPYDAGAPAWIIGDDDLLAYPYERELGANVQIATYNTGTFVHAWQVRLIYTPMSAVDLEPGVITIPPYTEIELQRLAL